MGRKQKAKMAKAASHACPDTTISSQRLAERAHTAELLPVPSCQALVDKDCRARCGGVSISLDGNWCEYHVKMRMDLHKLFRESLQEYHSTSDSIPDIALMQEAADIEGYWELLHTRIELLNKALLCRTCFMDRLQGNDLDFKTKKYIKSLRDARTRLESNLRNIEERMFILISSASAHQKSIFIIVSQSFGFNDQEQERCTHHTAHPDSHLRTLMFPIDRQCRHQLRANFQGNVVDAHISAECWRFRTEILEKLGVRVIKPMEYEEDSHYKLIVHWDNHDKRRRAHIAAAYFRRLCFVKSHLFVQAHHHMRALENGRLPLITIEDQRGRQLDFDKDIDPSLLCMITFFLNPHLKQSHLAMLRDYLWWPASSQVRAAVQDIYIDEDVYLKGKPPLKPWWSEPPKPASFPADNDCDDPKGAFPLLCGMLYEASYPQAHRDDTLTVSYWPHIGSLIRCGACLLTMAWSSDEWFILIRTFAIQRIPIYSRIFPQIIGDGAGNLWASDLTTDIVRGQNDPNRGYVSLAHLGVGQERGNSQVPRGPDFSSKYRLDQTLEIAGVVMLGVVTGGPALRSDMTDNQRRFLESFKLSPQIWFLLASDPEPLYKDFVTAFVHRLALRARRPGSDLMMSGIALEHPEIEEDLLNVPTFYNASVRRPGANSRWEPKYTGFRLLQEVAGMKYDPIPYRLMGGCPMIHLACRPTSPNGVRWLLDIVLEAAIEASSVRTKVELEELWMKSESSWVGSESDLEEPLPYRFGPWCGQDMRKKDAAVQTSSTSLEGEDGPSNALIASFQEAHTGTVEINRSQVTPLHTCRSHMPTNEAMAHYSPSQETLLINCSMPVGLPQQDHELRDSPPFSGAETSSTSQSSNPGPPLDDHCEHASRERVIFSELSPPNKDRGQGKVHTDWFDLVMSDEGNELPDLSDWIDPFTE